jgi:hypothetical protein
LGDLWIFARSEVRKETQISFGFGLSKIIGLKGNRRSFDSLRSLRMTGFLWKFRVDEKQMQVLRLTTPRLKDAWGPVRSG